MPKAVIPGHEDIAAVLAGVCVGRYVTIERPHDLQRDHVDDPDTIGGGGIVERVEARDGAVWLHWDWGMSWDVTNFAEYTWLIEGEDPNLPHVSKAAEQ